MSIKIMLVDNHVIVREGIRKLLECDTNFEIVAEVGSGEECYDKLEKIKIQLAIVDLDLTDVKELQIIEKIKYKNSTAKIIILTDLSDDSYIKIALDHDVNGFLSKRCDILELKKCIMKVLNNDIYIQQNLALKSNEKSKTKSIDRYKIKSLTKRELEVLIQIANGMFNKEIATTLNISERTVKNHVSNIFKKLGVSDRTQAAVFAIKNNVIDLFK